MFSTVWTFQRSTVRMSAEIPISITVHRHYIKLHRCYYQLWFTIGSFWANCKTVYINKMNLWYKWSCVMWCPTLTQRFGDMNCLHDYANFFDPPPQFLTTLSLDANRERYHPIIANTISIFWQFSLQDTWKLDNRWGQRLCHESWHLMMMHFGWAVHSSSTAYDCRIVYTLP